MTDLERPLDSPSFAEIATRYFDGLADDSEVALLTLALANNPQRQEQFVWLSYESRLLAQLLPSTVLADEQTETVGLPQRAWQTIATFAKDYIVLSLVVSTLTMTILLLSMALIVPEWKRYVPGSQPEPIAIVAEITETHNATWDATSDGNFKNIELFAGERLVLNSGLAEVTFADGAVLLLEGPVAFELDSAASGTLDTGKLFANVSPRAIGFTVTTPTAKIVDLGTEFGVVVSPTGDTLAEVFDGQVEISSIDDAGGVKSTRTLHAGQAASISPTANAIELVAATTKFTRRLAQPVVPVESRRSALPLHIDFEKPAADADVVARHYQEIDLDLNGGAARVEGGRLVLGPAEQEHPSEQFATVAQLPALGRGECLTVALDLGTAADTDGKFNVGIAIGNYTLRMHPDFEDPPGAFRVDEQGTLRSKNIDMGFVPASGVLHHLTLKIHASGLYEIAVVDGLNANNVFTTSFVSRSPRPGPLRLQREGYRRLESVWFDNVEITLSPCD